jgi:S1-C subfamily serine protease
VSEPEPPATVEPLVPADPPPQKSGTVNAWLVAVLLAAVAAIMVRNAGLYPSTFFGGSSEPRVVQPRGDLAEDEKSTIEVFKAASPSVVYITSLTVRRDRLSLDVMRIPSGTGTGFIWDDSGHIVTNLHVLESGNSAMVTLADNTRLPAQVVGIEPDQDIAVLKVTAPPGKLQPIPLGTSNDLQVGQKVFAIGNPFGLDQTLTTGVISGLGREIETQNKQTIHGVIQTDAAINPGNSGGPLLDSAGRLIGMNTAIYSTTGGFAGIGFAVPVDTVNDVVPQLIQSGRDARGGLGVSLLDDELARRLGVEQGAVIAKVAETGAAAAAGLRPPFWDEYGELQFEVITAIDGKPIHRAEDVLKTLKGRKVGEVVQVTLVRDGQEVVVSITLQSLQRPRR